MRRLDDFLFLVRYHLVRLPASMIRPPPLNLKREPTRPYHGTPVKLEFQVLTIGLDLQVCIVDRWCCQ